MTRTATLVVFSITDGDVVHVHENAGWRAVKTCKGCLAKTLNTPRRPNIKGLAHAAPVPGMRVLNVAWGLLSSAVLTRP